MTQRAPKSIRPADYLTMFRLKDKSNFLINSFLFHGSLRYGNPLIVQRQGFWTLYLRRSSLDAIGRRGYRLLRDQGRFSAYAHDFQKYLRMMEARKITGTEKAIFRDAKHFTALMADMGKLWGYYGYTESVYHDWAFLQIDKIRDTKVRKILSRNLNTLTELKARGRSLFNHFVMQGGVISRNLAAAESQYSADLNAGDASYITMRELSDLVRGRHLQSGVVAERRKAYVMGITKGKEWTMDASAAVNVADAFLTYEQQQWKEAEYLIRGTPAYPGRVRGRVIIAPMLDRAEAAKVAKKMKTGDILVAQSTNPDLMILCEKAGAIVTNQGGMLSHAAIISREMEKPCIVGTTLATKVLHDGDLVEVDANKGTVRKIRSAT